MERAVGHARYDGTFQLLEGASAKTHIGSQANNEKSELQKHVMSIKLFILPKYLPCLNVNISH